MNKRRRTVARVVSLFIAIIMVLAMGASIFASSKHTENQARVGGHLANVTVSVTPKSLKLTGARLPSTFM